MSPVAVVHSTVKVKVSSRSSGWVAGPVVVLVIDSVDVVFVTSISSPSVVIVASGPTLVVKRASGVSTTAHSEPVGSSGITSGASTEIWPVMTSVAAVNPPAQVTVTSKSSASRSVIAGTPTSVLSMVRDPVSRSFVNAAVTTPSESTVSGTGFGETSVQPVGAACSVTVQSVPSGSAGRSEKRRKPVAVVGEVMVSATTVWVPEYTAPQSTAKSNDSVTSTGNPEETWVFLTIMISPVAFTRATSSPSVSMVTPVVGASTGVVVVAKRGSGSSITVHTAPVGRSSIVIVSPLTIG